GFELDLRHKILGSNAHMLVTKEEEGFREYREVEKKIDGVCAGRRACVVAHAPYLSSEVVVAANSNYNPVIIKGIDPAKVASVTAPGRSLAEGSPDRAGPLPPDGGVARGAPAPDAGVAPDAGAEEAPPPSFAGPEEDEEPVDFSGSPAD